MHPTPVRPAVLQGEFVHTDNEEGSGVVVVQRETSIFVFCMFFSTYQGLGGHIVIIVMAEVLSIALQAVSIVTSEVKSLSFHTSNSCGFDTDQSCQSEKAVLVVYSCKMCFNK